MYTNREASKHRSVFQARSGCPGDTLNIENLNMNATENFDRGLNHLSAARSTLKLSTSTAIRSSYAGSKTLSLSGAASGTDNGNDSGGIAKEAATYAPENLFRLAKNVAVKATCRIQRPETHYITFPPRQSSHLLPSRPGPLNVARNKVRNRYREAHIHICQRCQ